MTAFAGGDLYFTDGGQIREVSSQTGIMSTPVGPVRGDTSRNGGLATSFAADTAGLMIDKTGNLVMSTPGHLRVAARSTGRFYGQAMVEGHVYAIARFSAGNVAYAVDPHGNFVLADRLANQVLVLAMTSGHYYGQAMVAGRTYVVAGTGTAGRTGDRGPARDARLYGPTSAAVDPAGNLVVADTMNSRIRVVAVKTGQFYGQQMSRGDIYTIVNKDGAWFNGGFGGDGGRALLARINHPTDVAFDTSGNLLIADGRNYRIRVVAAHSGTFYGATMIAGRIYTVAGNGRLTWAGSGDGGPALDAGILPSLIAVDGFGNLVIPDVDQVQVVAASDGTFYGQPMTRGDIYTVAGFTPYSHPLLQDGWPAPSVQLDGQSGIAVDAHGNVVAADSNAPADGFAAVYVMAGQTGTFYGRPMISGHYYPIAGAAEAGQPGNGGPPFDASIQPYGVAIDHSGNLVVTDLWNDQVRVIANGTGTFYGQQMTAGDIYLVAGGGSGSPGSGDGGSANQAVLRAPGQVTVDGVGNIVFADTGDHRIRVVAASTGLYYGQQMTAGDIYTIAGTGVQGTSPDGTLAISAMLEWTRSVTLDGHGNVLIGDAVDELVRVVAAQSGSYYGRPMLAGHLYTIAGGAKQGLGDGGPARRARLDIGLSILVDQAGNIVIPGGGRVRVVATSDGTYYGVPMTAGDIYTIAGTGVSGFSGDGGLAVRAVMEDPQSVAADAAGNLVVGDGPRIRQVSY